MMGRTFPAINMSLWETKGCPTKTELMGCVRQKCGNLITETGSGWGWQGDHPVQPPCSRVTTGLHPGGFGISPEKETAQPLCEACSSALSSSHTHELLALLFTHSLAELNTFQSVSDINSSSTTPPCCPGFPRRNGAIHHCVPTMSLWLQWDHGPSDKQQKGKSSTTAANSLPH